MISDLFHRADYDYGAEAEVSIWYVIAVSGNASYIHQRLKLH